MKRIIVALLLLLPAVAASPQLIVNITESGKVTSYYDQYWVVNVEGTMTVTNPFNNSFDYVQFRLSLGTLTIIEDNATHIFYPDRIYIPYIGSQKTMSAHYTIRGISAYDPMDNNQSVMRTAIGDDKGTLYTFMISNIRKSDIENQTINLPEIKSKAKRRLVTVTLENPSDLSQNISSIRVIKTPEQDPNNELRSWHFPAAGGNIIIGPHESWSEDIIDENSTEGEVYWLSTEAETDTVPIVTGDQIISRFTQEDLFNVENATHSELEQLENISDYLEHLMYLKKSVSKSTVWPGDLVTMSVKVNNFAPINRLINLTETLPSGFRVSDSGNANRTTDQSLFWAAKVNPDTSRLFTYELEFFDNDTIGLDYFEPAVLKYENETLYSERIAFVRQYIPDKRVFIQKKLRYSVEDEIVVQIQVQNLGESEIQDLYVREFLGANDVFREISQAPESKGRWRIPVLKRDEIWEVTYITDENEAVNLLPEVYGVDNKIVLKTLVFENIVRNEWLEPTIFLIEILAPLFMLGFIIFFFIYSRRVHTKSTNSLRRLGKAINSLKRDTDLKPQESISILKRESTAKKDIPTVGAPNVPPTKDGLRNIAHDNIDRLKQIDEDTKKQ